MTKNIYKMMHSYSSGHVVIFFGLCICDVYSTLQDEMQYIFLEKSFCSWTFQLLKLPGLTSFIFIA